MEIEFSKDKSCSAFEELMNNPEDRKSLKKFNKLFDSTIMKASINVYQKLKSSKSALIYNQTTSNKNRIELVTGKGKKETLVLKVRINSDYRKFFYFYQTDTLGNEEFCTKEQWIGQFDDVCKIYVFSVNKHDYSIV